MKTVDRPDMYKEKLYLLNDIARAGDAFPWPVTYSTVWKYVREGRVNISGVTVFLECLKTASGLATSYEACERFLRDLNT